MSDRLKFILKIAGFVLACVLIALAIYFVFFRKAVTIITTPPGTTVGGVLPGASTGAPGTTPGGVTPGETPGGTELPPSAVADGGETFTTLLTNTSVKSPTVTADGTVA